MNLFARYEALRNATINWQETIYTMMAALTIRDLVFDASLFHKHQGFEEENEWRCVYGYRRETPDGSVPPIEDEIERSKQAYLKREKSRVGQLGLIPYIEASFSDRTDIVSQVVLGPKINVDLTKPVSMEEASSST